MWKCKERWDIELTLGILDLSPTIFTWEDENKRIY